MYGCQRAMDGNCYEAMRRVGKFLLPVRLAASLMLSLGIHAILLFLQVSQTGSVAGARAVVGGLEVGGLQVLLTPRGKEIHVQHISADSRSATIVSGRPVREASMFAPSGGFSGVLPEREPELASEIDSEIDDPRVRGFMIVHLQVNESGAVDAADVIYSELPSEVAEMLMKRFASARFKPAVRNGQVAEASILLRIDVD